MERETDLESTALAAKLGKVNYSRCLFCGTGVALELAKGQAATTGGNFFG